MHVNLTKHKIRHKRAFTLIEIVVVITIIGLIYGLVFTRGSYFAYYKQEGFFRKLTETIAFLHQRAIIDGTAYKIVFNFGDPLNRDREPPYYQIFELTTGSVASNAIGSSFQNNPINNLAAGNLGPGALSLEIANVISASFNEEQEGRAPQNFPSLRAKEFLPEGLNFKDIRLQSGLLTQHSQDELPSIFFSPQGFSDFAVIHFKAAEKGEVTILVNPFSGLSQIFREYKDFEWTFGRQKK